ncbi:hypothetical protein DEO72_LG3g928 [Vigna unguiculata]|uniref:Uncharacterized protein n=1 Tax=Vigna unguiculata TaxID=3917 RepID=A0A4D6LDC9_VIGUN|nr:hypothetical protein DEO72_LG3g928 [Vigna unguiculata]
MDFKEMGVGYRRVGASNKVTVKSFDINVTYLRTAITDVMTRVLTIRYSLNHMRESVINEEITTYVPHIVNMCMSALYAKLHNTNKTYGLHATRYTTDPSYTKDIELPLPLALAIQEFGSFRTHSLQENKIMVPTYPEGTQFEERSVVDLPIAEYLAYVPTLLQLGIQMKSVDAEIGKGSAWWTYKVEVILSTTDFLCTLPRSHYSDMSALLRMLFLSGSEESHPEDVVTFADNTTTYGTLVHRLTTGFNSRTILALIHSPSEECSFGSV